MSIPIQCGHCSKRYEAPDHFAGKRIKCPKCGQPVTIPGSAPKGQPSGKPRRPAAADNSLFDDAGDDFAPPSREPPSRHSRRKKRKSGSGLSGKTMAIAGGVVVGVVVLAVAGITLLSGGSSSSTGDSGGLAKELPPPAWSQQPDTPPPAQSAPDSPSPPSSPAPPSVPGLPNGNAAPPQVAPPGTSPPETSPPEMGPPGPPDEPVNASNSSRPADVADWQNEDFYSARAEGDPMLIDAIRTLADRAPGSENVANNLVKLLQPIETVQGAPAIVDTRLLQTIVATLGANGSEPACFALHKILAGTLPNDDDRTAVGTALAAMVAFPCAEYDELLFQALTAPDALRPAPSAGQISPGEMQRMARAEVGDKGSSGLLMMLANYVSDPTLPQPLRDELNPLLRGQNPENLGAQVTLWQSATTDDATKSQIERELSEHASNLMQQMLGVTHGGNAVVDAFGETLVAPGGADAAIDLAALAQRAAILWGPQSAATIEKRLAETRSLDGHGPLVMLAGTLPVESTRVMLRSFLKVHGVEGPSALESAGLTNRMVCDPGMILTLKTLPRIDESGKNVSVASRLSSASSAARSRQAAGQMVPAMVMGPNGQMMPNMVMGPNGQMVPAMVMGPNGQMIPNTAVGPNGQINPNMVMGPNGQMMNPNMVMGPNGQMMNPNGMYPNNPMGQGMPIAPNQPMNPNPPVEAIAPGDPFAEPEGGPKTYTVEDQQRAAEDWMKTSQALVLAWCERLHAAGPAQAQAAMTAGKRPQPDGLLAATPIKLHRDARIVSQYHQVWPADQATVLSGVAAGPIEIHYVRLRDQANPISRLGNYRRQTKLEANEARPIEIDLGKGVWLDRLAAVTTKKDDPKAGWLRSVDVLITVVDDGSADADEDEPLVAADDPENLPEVTVQILTIEMPSPVRE